MSELVTKRFGHDERELTGSRKVWKYPLTKKDNVVEFDGKTEVLPLFFAPHSMYVGDQLSEFAVWCELNNSDDSVFAPIVPSRMTFHFIGTGQPIPDKFEYINSCQHNGLVWHLYWSWE